jgi:hypothetical protein
LALLGTLIIGFQWTEVNKTPWNNDRIGIEQVYYGMTVDKRIGEGKTRIINLRPERIGPEFPIPYPIALTSQMWSNSEINQTFSLGGYVPLKGIPRYEQMIEFAKTSESVPFYKLLAKAQTGWLIDSDSAKLDSINCIYDQSCLIKESNVTPVSWDISKLEFEISSPSVALMVVNEIPWEGWRAKVCDSNNCKEVKVNTELDHLLLAVQVDASTEKVIFEYFQPYKEISWIIFWIALALIIMIAYARTLAIRI